jgi:hypothetical protein
MGTGPAQEMRGDERNRNASGSIEGGGLVEPSSTSAPAWRRCRGRAKTSPGIVPPA